jgi:hypothetical protein
VGGGAKGPCEVLLLLPLALIGFLTTTGADSFKTASRTDVADVDTGSEEDGGFGKRSTESTSSNQPSAVPALIEALAAQSDRSSAKT